MRSGIALLLCLSLTTGGATLGSLVSGANGANLQFNASSFDFGDVFRGEVLRHDFNLHNSGSAVIELTNLAPRPARGKSAANIGGPKFVESERPAQGNTLATLMNPRSGLWTRPVMYQTSRQTGTDAARLQKNPSQCACHVADFEFPRSLQPGETGVVRLTMRTAGESGILAREYKLYTNDPAQPSVAVKLTAHINPPPAWMGRLQGADIAEGEQAGSLLVWPTAHPDLRLAKGEALKISLRVRQVDSESEPNKTAPSDASATAAGGPTNAAASGRTGSGNGPNGGNGNNGGNNGLGPAAAPIKLTDKAVVMQVRPNSTGKDSWVDISIAPIGDLGTFSWSKVIPDHGSQLAGVQVALTISVVDDNLLVLPAALNVDGVTIPENKGASVNIGRIELRRALRPFQIKEVSCSLPFVRAEVQPIVSQQRYSVRLRIVGNAVPSSNSYKGSITIKTDDKRHSVIEVPLKINLAR